MKLLIIEDDRRALSYLQKGLQESGCTVDTAENGIDGARHQRSHPARPDRRAAGRLIHRPSHPVLDPIQALNHDLIAFGSTDR